MRRRTFIAAAAAPIVPAVGTPSVNEIQAVIEARVQARRDGDDPGVHVLTEQLAARGVTLRDAPHGTYWSRG